MAGTKQDAIYTLWDRGKLRYLLRPAQVILYDNFKHWQITNPDSPGPVIFNCHRGMGKSFLLLSLAVERCLQIPGTSAAYGGPELEKTWEIVGHNWNNLQFSQMGYCPLSLRGSPKNGTHTILFHNPRWPDGLNSTLQVFGINGGHGNLQRGKRYSMVVVDEAGFCDDLEYVVGGVLQPTFIGQPDPIMLLSSTPPKTAGHPFVTTYVENAQADGRLFMMTQPDNPSQKERDDVERVVLAGGKSKESTDWRREALCELISDIGLLAVPSFTLKKDAIVLPSWDRPSHFYPLVSGDLGFKDYNGIVFSYLDFLKQKLVIEEEFFRNFLSTKELAGAVVEREGRLWDKTPHYADRRRWADGTSQQLADLQREHSLHFSYPKAGEKWDKWAGLAYLDTLFLNERIVILPPCMNLIFQLSNAVKNDRLTDMERIPRPEFQDPTKPAAGHWDLLWALAYLVHCCKSYWNMNPFPADMLVGTDIYIPPDWKPDAQKWCPNGGERIVNTQKVVSRRPLR